MLQEVAGNHALQLEFDITDLQQKQRTWVLHRLTIAINRYPDWRETVTIKTWPSGGDGLRAYRDFLILDEEAVVIAKSLSYWLILDMKKRRPIRIPESILAMAPAEKDHVLPVTDGTFEEIEASVSGSSFTVRPTDLDLNRHVNNVRYIEWMMAGLPDKADIRTLDVKFIAEAMQGDLVEAALDIKDPNAPEPTFRHQLKRSGDQKVLVLSYSQ